MTNSVYSHYSRRSETWNVNRNKRSVAGSWFRSRRSSWRLVCCLLSAGACNLHRVGISFAVFRTFFRCISFFSSRLLYPGALPPPGSLSLSLSLLLFEKGREENRTSSIPRPCTEPLITHVISQCVLAQMSPGIRRDAPFPLLYLGDAGSRDVLFHLGANANTSEQGGSLEATRRTR